MIHRRHWLTQSLTAGLATQFAGSRPATLLAMTSASTPSFRPVIRRIRLRTADAARLARFYRNALGLVPRPEAASPHTLALQHPASGETLLTLVEDKRARPASPAAPGLFHIAFLFEQLDGWRTAVTRTLEAAEHFHGASDHGVSWAVYLEDPDGNGLELAWDKPASEWTWRGDQIQMVTCALPLRSILLNGPLAADAGPFCIGHLHLQVRDLADAGEYAQRLGLRVTQADYPGALFLARDRYHHHLAVNTWRTSLRATREENATGLIGWDMTHDSPTTTWRDPSGSLVTLRPA